MIIDDDLDILSLLRDVFSYNEYEVDAQSDPVLALKHFYENAQSFDLVLLDIRLSDGNDGLILQQVKRRQSRGDDICIYCSTSGSCAIHKDMSFF